MRARAASGRVAPRCALAARTYEAQHATATKTATQSRRCGAREEQKGGSEGSAPTGNFLRRLRGRLAALRPAASHPYFSTHGPLRCQCEAPTAAPVGAGACRREGSMPCPQLRNFGAALDTPARSSGQPPRPMVPWRPLERAAAPGRQAAHAPCTGPTREAVQAARARHGPVRAWRRSAGPPPAGGRAAPPRPPSVLTTRGRRLAQGARRRLVAKANH